MSNDELPLPLPVPATFAPMLPLFADIGSASRLSFRVWRPACDELFKAVSWLERLNG